MKIQVNKQNVGLRIKQFRLNKGYTLGEFGKFFDTSDSIVSRWEKAKALPNKERIRAIAKFMDITVNELLYGSVEEFARENFEYMLSMSSDVNSNKDLYDHLMQHKEEILKKISILYKNSPKLISNLNNLILKLYDEVIVEYMVPVIISSKAKDIYSPEWQNHYLDPILERIRKSFGEEAERLFFLTVYMPEPLKIEILNKISEIITLQLKKENSEDYNTYLIEVSDKINSLLYSIKNNKKQD
ncbi:MAG: helix-turn-helix transcriptional regulator [Gemella sp.]|nr:helix-turn-helix transcriptional regulator [Gemella sp.]